MGKTKKKKKTLFALWCCFYEITPSHHHPLLQYHVPHSWCQKKMSPERKEIDVCFDLISDTNPLHEGKKHRDRTKWQIIQFISWTWIAADREMGPNSFIDLTMYNGAVCGFRRRNMPSCGQHGTFGFELISYVEWKNEKKKRKMGIGQS